MLLLKVILILKIKTMYILIKDDKAERLEGKLHKVKEFICEVIEEIKEAREHKVDKEELHHMDMARRSTRHNDYDRDRYDDEDDDYTLDMARRGCSRGRGRY